MVYLKYETSTKFTVLSETSGVSLYQHFCLTENGKDSEVYFISNGKLVGKDASLHSGCIVHIVPKILGGKGGFGSMLRTVGSQIKKTTNIESCRDKSGRRLRVVNEERRFQTCVMQKDVQENEAAERKRKKLEKMCELPKHQFADDAYYQQQDMWSKRIEESLMFEPETSLSTKSDLKRKMTSPKKSTHKRIRIWIDDDIEESDSEVSVEDDTIEETQ